MGELYFVNRNERERLFKKEKWLKENIESILIGFKKALLARKKLADKIGSLLFEFFSSLVFDY